VGESDWQRPEFYFLATGCLLVVGSFVAGTNVGYRSIMLLFVVPGLLDLKVWRQEQRAESHSDRNVVDDSVPTLEGLLPAWC
jgi:hypothetical protein